MERTRAFTLIELLVVIAIIALLAGMLMGALGTVRSAAKSTRCSASQRQIHLGAMAYANDFEGILVPILPTDPGAPNGLYDHWMRLLATYVDASPTGDIPASTNDIPRTSVLWGCPEWKYVLNQTAKTGYGMNRWPFNAPGLPAIEQQRSSVHQATRYQRDIPLAQITYPGQRPYLGDSTYLYIYTNTGSPTTYSFEPPTASDLSNGWKYGGGDPDRHKGRANYVFYDGHAGSLPAARASIAFTDPATY